MWNKQYLNLNESCPKYCPLKSDVQKSLKRHSVFGLLLYLRFFLQDLYKIVKSSHTGEELG